MLLGKRPRPPIRRTTSMTGITVDLNNVEDQEPTENPSMMDVHASSTEVGPDGPVNYNQSPNSLGYHEQHRFLAMLSPRTNSSNHRRNSASDLVETAHFLRTCGLCKRSLASGRDLYMYRGDTAFCSLECREQQMKQDERVEKCKGVASKKEDRHATRPSSKASGKTQTVAAA
ncbi:putative Zf-FLZ domain-containing protein [Rosa chinensis]|uniref:Putative Zf-FLZ domain-containing protein n=1 Tax=Rosa chinensis TaxID=74649 RepID=A0A2P6RQX8_ROSCH|nr:FCS-Like Zinc finger 5 [Rosa chinensis]PRQ48845.1 putative Zf-FLZ domain-containing protein [Rosa chinensis]